MIPFQCITSFVIGWVWSLSQPFRRDFTTIVKYKYNKVKCMSFLHPFQEWFDSFEFLQSFATLRKLFENVLWLIFSSWAMLRLLKFSMTQWQSINIIMDLYSIIALLLKRQALRKVFWLQFIQRSTLESIRS